ncbi:hypothetical protein [Alteromonas sp. a30]|uniref:hypothetical protein n=1 Tax=Alteromonas sp. a30 TaxID=2730917 RepID=UPI00227DE532|nr:hypothetical protein [Alteromonas sp. a30]MCY7294682.1 hypothetical protein [Alteromonas sp. a30]
MKFIYSILALGALLIQTSAFADNLYQVTLLRAAPGNLPSLIDEVKHQKRKQNGNIVIMRHSQGDHWDLMLLSPASETLPKPHRYDSLADFQHDFIAQTGANWKAVKQKADDAGLFHIEMFRAAAGKHQALLEERHMENDYLVKTQRKANIIFVTRFGSDYDNFSVGFYKDMQAFAANPDLPAEAFEKAAKDAGFAARSDIGFHLRRYLVGHNDTLATQVK